MWLCLNCRHLCPDGRYCLFCGRTRGRVCTRGHVSPAYANRCGVCGSVKLTRATPWIPLSIVSRTLSFIVLLVVLRWSLTLSVDVASLFLSGAQAAISFVWGGAPHALRSALVVLAAWGATLYLVSWMLPASAGLTIRRALIAAIRHAVGFIASTLAMLWRAWWSRPAKQGTSPKPETTAEPGGEHGK